MCLFIGVDGGATKTRVVVTSDSGVFLGEGRAGASNYQITGVESAARALEQGIQMALAAAGADAGQVAAVGAGFAGLDGPADVGAITALVEEALHEANVGASWWAANDAVAAWAGALGGKPGAIVISGSGAIALAVNEAGLMAKGDGWGHWLGDEGSGFDIGRQGLQAALRAADRRGAATLLLDRMQRRHSRAAVDGWRSWVTALNGAAVHDAHAQIASFAPEVVQAAAKGDSVARTILCNAGAALADTAFGVLNQLDLLASPAVATVGSLFVHSLILRDYFTEHLQELLPSAVIQWPQHQPAEGAALLARRPELIPKDVLIIQGKV